MKHANMVTYNTMLFLSKKIAAPPLLGAPGAQRLRFIEPPEPPVSTPLENTDIPYADELQK